MYCVGRPVVEDRMECSWLDLDGMGLGQILVVALPRPDVPRAQLDQD